MTRHIAFDRLHNFRDLGGYRTQDGRTVRWNQLYRSDSLGKLQGDDWNRFLQMGIRSVIDLRYPWEIEAKGRIPVDAGFTYHNLSIEHQAYDQAALSADLDATRFLADRYAEVAEDGILELRKVFRVIGEERDGAVVFHCASGKDRTGIVSALVLGLLGVSEADIVADFALTELATERLLSEWREANPGKGLPWPWYGKAPAQVMQFFLEDLAGRYGSLQDYVVHQLKVDDALVEELRNRLLTPVTGEADTPGPAADVS